MVERSFDGFNVLVGFQAVGVVFAIFGVRSRLYLHLLAVNR